MVLVCSNPTCRAVSDDMIGSLEELKWFRVMEVEHPGKTTYCSPDCYAKAKRGLIRLDPEVARRWHLRQHRPTDILPISTPVDPDHHNEDMEWERAN